MNAYPDHNMSPSGHYYPETANRTMEVDTSIEDYDLLKSGQLAYHGSQDFKITDSELFDSARKKDQWKDGKDRLRPEAMVRIPQVPK